MRKLVTIQEIKEIKPIEGADSIDVATIKGWKVVVQKGLHEIGDKVVYFEIDSFLPIKPEYDFLLRGSKPKKMLVDGGETEGIRLKTIKLRGQLSQGLIMPLPNEMRNKEVGEDVSDELGVIKYEMPIPANLAEKVKGTFPSFIPKTNEERIQNMESILSPYYVSEKLDGTSITIYKKDGELSVCSRNLELKEGEGTQWKIARELDIPEGIALQGELVGEGIQKNPLKIKGQKFYCFNVFNIESGAFLNYDNLVGFCKAKNINIVPIVAEDYQLPLSVDELLKYAEGKSLINKESEREGVVIRPKIEAQYNGERLSFKAISNKYLLKD